VILSGVAKPMVAYKSCQRTLGRRLDIEAVLPDMRRGATDLHDAGQTVAAAPPMSSAVRRQ